MTTKGFFITGTDTEVGKTLVAAAIILKLQQLGLQAVGYKPVVAGMQNVGGQFINEDIETLLSVSKNVQASLHAKDICSYFLNDPAAPHLVAKRENVRLELNQMLHDFKKLQHQFDAIVVEGAGGFLVPINAHQTLADLADQIQLPVILVVSIKLGCINHALLTAEVLRQRGLKLTGWVANLNWPENVYTVENIATLQDLLHDKFNCVHLGTIPGLKNPIQDGSYTLDTIKQAAEFVSIPISVTL
jgi:dethiobiotin synthetase